MNCRDCGEGFGANNPLIVRRVFETYEDYPIEGLKPNKEFEVGRDTVDEGEFLRAEKYKCSNCGEEYTRQEAMKIVWDSIYSQSF